MSRNIAFVTCSVKPDFAANDLYAVDALRSAGVQVHAVPWDDDTTNWNSFELVVIRSSWNYHHHPDKFGRWLKQLEGLEVKVFNPINILHWNLHKGYLQDLESKGVLLPETIWLEKGTQENLEAVMRSKNWDRAVVKPAISATAFNTFLVSLSEASQQNQNFLSLLSQADMLVQKFMPEVQEQGEWSLIFFDKKFSHAVIKRPAGKDFRVQNDFGGTATEGQPPAFALKQAKKILELVDEPLLYTRVDGVIAENQFLLIELELIEPMLFLNKTSGEIFANAILRHLTVDQQILTNKRLTINE